MLSISVLAVKMLYKRGPQTLHIDYRKVAHKNVFHTQEDLNIVLLGEKHKIYLPTVSETKLYFTKYFDSAELYILPACQWVTLEVALEQMLPVQRSLHNLKQIPVMTKECNTQEWNEIYFKDKEAALISQYTFNHYMVSFYIKKFNTEQKIYALDQDYFQLVINVDKK